MKGEKQIRIADIWPDPFPLYPGEVQDKVKPLPIIPPNQALRLVARRGYVDSVVSDASASSISVQRHAGDEFMFYGPGVYIPRAEVDVVETVNAMLIKAEEALKLRARRECCDREGNPRKACEEWLVRKPGLYLPNVDEIVAETVQPEILTHTRALHLRALDSFTDVYGVQRNAGDEYLMQMKSRPPTLWCVLLVTGKEEEDDRTMFNCE